MQNGLHLLINRISLLRSADKVPQGENVLVQEYLEKVDQCMRCMPPTRLYNATMPMYTIQLLYSCLQSADAVIVFMALHSFHTLVIGFITVTAALPPGGVQV